MKADYRDSVHAGSLSDLVRYLERSGLSVDTFFRGAGIAPAFKADPDARIPIAAMHACWKTALEMTGNPALALAVGADYSSSSHGVLGHLIAHSETIKDALKVYCRYVILLSGGLNLELTEADGRAAVSMETDEPDPQVWPRVVERTFAAIMSVARKDVLGDFALDAAEFDYPEPPYGKAYRRYFGARCRFGARRSRLVFARGLLSLPMRHRHSGLQALLAREAESAFREVTQGRGALGSSLRGVIPTLLDKGQVSAQSAATALHLGVRTFHRRLADEGTTYLKVLDKARCDRALQLIDMAGISIEEIAFACGFLEVSGFFRAFRRWTGATPRSYRKSRREKGSTRHPSARGTAGDARRS